MGLYRQPPRWVLRQPPREKMTPRMTVRPRRGRAYSPGISNVSLLRPLPPPRHGVGKGLMIGKGPVAPDPASRLFTHKDYAIEMVNLITQETDLDPCS